MGWYIAGLVVAIVALVLLFIDLDFDLSIRWDRGRSKRDAEPCSDFDDDSTRGMK